jgi:hypothetical protein
MCSRGFVVETHLGGEDRILTFLNATVGREFIQDVDGQRRRLVWSVADGTDTHVNASPRSPLTAKATRAS